MGKETCYQKELKYRHHEKLVELKKALPKYARAYLDHIELRLNLNTVVSYAYDLQTFFRFLKDCNPLCKDYETSQIPEELLNQLTYEDIDEFQRYLEYNTFGDGHCNGIDGIARRMSALRGMYGFCCTHHYMTNDPTLGAAKRKKPENKDIVRMTSDEVKEVIRTVETTSLSSERQQQFCSKTRLRDSAILYLLLHTGIRVSECVGLDISDISFKDHSLSITRKRGKIQRLSFSAETAKHLKDYIENERPSYYDEEIEKNALFLSSRKKRMCVKSVENVVKKYAKEAVPGKHITAHKCRSTYATALYNQTEDIYLVASVLGHEDINTTKRYSAIDETRAKRAASIDLFNEN